MFQKIHNKRILSNLDHFVKFSRKNVSTRVGEEREFSPIAILGLDKNNKLVLQDYHFYKPDSSFDSVVCKNAPSLSVTKQSFCDNLSVTKISKNESTILHFVTLNIDSNNQFSCNSKLLSTQLNIAHSTVRQCFKRLLYKGFLRVVSQKFGKGTISKTTYFLLKNSVTNPLSFCDNLSVTNPGRSYIDRSKNLNSSQQSLKSVTPKKSYSSDFQKQLEQLYIPDDLKKLDISSKRFRRLDGKRTIEEINLSLQHFEYDLKNNLKNPQNPLAYLLSSLQRGQYVSSTLQKKQLEEMQYQKEKQLRIQKLEEQAFLEKQKKLRETIDSNLESIYKKSHEKQFASWQKQNAATVTKIMTKSFSTSNSIKQMLVRASFENYIENQNIQKFTNWLESNKELITQLYPNNNHSYSSLKSLYLSWNVDVERTKSICNFVLFQKDKTDSSTTSSKKKEHMINKENRNSEKRSC